MRAGVISLGHSPGGCGSRAQSPENQPQTPGAGWGQGAASPPPTAAPALFLSLGPSTLEPSGLAVSRSHTARPSRYWL